MNKTKSYTIRLLNKAYVIKCPEDEEENLQLAAEQLNQYMLENKKKFKQLGEFQSMLLAALRMSHELINRQATQEDRQSQLNQFIQSLENKISQASEISPNAKSTKTIDSVGD